MNRHYRTVPNEHSRTKNYHSWIFFFLSSLDGFNKIEGDRVNILEVRQKLSNLKSRKKKAKNSFKSLRDLWSNTKSGVPENKEKRGQKKFFLKN